MRMTDSTNIFSDTNRIKTFIILLFLSMATINLQGCQNQQPNLNPCFSINAIAGVPAHETIQADAYEEAAGRIRHKGSSLAQLRIFMPVVNTTSRLSNDVNWDRLAVMYLDPDGRADDYRVRAKLQYLDGAGGTPTVAELDSNTESSTGINTMTKAFNHTFDFVNRYYYVEIKINRKNTNGSPWIGGVKLCEHFQ